MKRRDAFLVPLVIGAPSLGWTQQAGKTYRIGWLGTAALGPRPTFRAALREMGWIEGKDFVFEVRIAADGQSEQLPVLAADLMRANVDVVVAVAPSAIRAAKLATTKTPIVMAFWGGSDLVESGIVASLARPGGNITGVHMLLQTLDAKRLELLHHAVPNAKRIAVLIHDRQAFEPQLPPVREVARQAGLELVIVNTRDGDRGYDGAFEAINRAGAQALLVMGSPVFQRDRKLISDLAARWRMPAIVGSRSSAQDGLLMAYGTIEEELDRQAARFVDRILRGANPGDLPIEQPTKFELVINLKAAKTLGLTIPQSLLLRADEVIQ